MIRAISISAVSIALLAATGCGVGDAQTRVRSAVDARNPELNQCYASALERDRNTSGNMRAWIYVEDEQGRIERVEFTEGVQDQQLQACMEGTLQQVQLEEAPPANLKIEYTFDLQPQPAPPAPQPQPQQPQPPQDVPQGAPPQG